MYCQQCEAIKFTVAIIASGLVTTTSDHEEIARRSIEIAKALEGKIAEEHELAGHKTGYPDAPGNLPATEGSQAATVVEQQTSSDAGKTQAPEPATAAA